MKMSAHGVGKRSHWIFLGKNRHAKQCMQTSTQPALSDTATRGGSFRQGVLSVVGFSSSLLASLIGAAFATVLTLNYLEPFRAEENLRKFALTEIYKPMRAKAVECLALRTQRYVAMGQTSVLVGLGYATFQLVSKGPDFANTPATPQQVEPLTRELNAAMKVVSENTALLSTCALELDNMRKELATVLSLTNELEALEILNRKARPKEIPFIKKSNATIDMLIHPEKLIAIIRAGQDGADGHVTRGVAAAQKVDSLIVELMKGFNAAAAQEERLIAIVSREDREINELFLRNLKTRFEKTPTSYLWQSVPPSK